MAKSNKYQGHWQVFDKGWFNRNQPRLLSWINGSWLKRKLARYALRIDIKEDLAEISSSYYTIDLPNGEKQSTFRTHDKYSKRVYYSLLPIWWMLHFIDWVFMDRFAPQYSFGFATLTAYPEAGSGGGNTTCDGWLNVDVSGFPQSWSVCRDSINATGVSKTDSFSFIALVSSANAGNVYIGIARGSFTFDTSSLPDSTTISAVDFKPYIQAKNNTFAAGDSSLDIVSTSPATDNDIAAVDYYYFGTTSYSNLAYASINTGARNTFSFNATGISAVSKTGVTKIGTRLGCDRSNTEPTWGSSKTMDYSSYFADNTGTTEDPELVVTYSDPVTYKASPILVL
jgi:hypothetical protein